MSDVEDFQSSLQNSAASIEALDQETESSLEDDQTFGLDTDIEEKKVNNYVILTPDDIQKLQCDEISRVAELVSVPDHTARQLLTYFDWDADKLIDKFFGGEADKIYKGAGIQDPETKSPVPKKAKSEDKCTICWLDYPISEMSQVGCGHVFCNDCWRSFLKITIVDDGKAKIIRCPGSQCTKQLDELFIKKIISDNKILTRYYQLLTQAFVESNKNIRFCPGRGCENAVKVQLLKDKEVFCSCGTRFCFGCGQLPHLPADCSMVKHWMKQLEADSENAQFLASYTKECPQCESLIHKDGGCQYMTCAQCNHRFCWVCLGAFDHKDHACNKFKEDSWDKNSARAHLNKYMHFYTRYIGHDQSSKFEDKLLAEAEKTMLELSSVGAAWIDVQYIKNATLQLMESRNMLKWTYVYGYYLPEHVNREIFEYLQADLEAGTEKLSGLLESKTDKVRLDILNAADYVKQRVKKMIDGLIEDEITGGSGMQRTYTSNEFQKYDGWIYTVSK